MTFKNLTLNANLGPAAAYPLGHSMLEAAQGAEVAEGSQKPEAEEGRALSWTKERIFALFWSTFEGFFKGF